MTNTNTAPALTNEQARVELNDLGEKLYTEGSMEAAWGGTLGLDAERGAAIGKILVTLDAHGREVATEMAALAEKKVADKADGADWHGDSDAARRYRAEAEGYRTAHEILTRIA